MLSASPRPTGRTDLHGSEHKWTAGAGGGPGRGRATSIRAGYRPARRSRAASGGGAAVPPGRMPRPGRRRSPRPGPGRRHGRRRPATGGDGRRRGGPRSRPRGGGPRGGGTGRRTGGGSGSGPPGRPSAPAGIAAPPRVVAEDQRAAGLDSSTPSGVPAGPRDRSSGRRPGSSRAATGAGSSPPRSPRREASRARGGVQGRLPRLAEVPAHPQQVQGRRPVRLVPGARSSDLRSAPSGRASARHPAGLAEPGRGPAGGGEPLGRRLGVDLRAWSQSVAGPPRPARRQGRPKPRGSRRSGATWRP